MNDRSLVSRRQLLRILSAAGVLGLSRAGIAWAELLQRTPGQILGPFYPVAKPASAGADLTLLPGRTGRADGQVIHVMGRVLNARGEAVPGARLEIWQANARGRYRHPSDSNPAALDPNFDGYTTLVSDAQGRYAFKTIKPGSYPAGPGLIRPPHIHFDVTAKSDRLVTQMYFAGEPLNAKDPFLNSAPARDRLIVALKDGAPPLEEGALVAMWDIVLENG